MGGGIIQLAAYGASDIYLTGNPQITFFKVVYRRHTNFSMEAIEQTLNGTAIAVGRILIALLENNQTNDGEVEFSDSLGSILGVKKLS